MHDDGGEGLKIAHNYVTSFTDDHLPTIGRKYPLTGAFCNPEKIISSFVNLVLLKRGKSKCDQFSQ